MDFENVTVEVDGAVATIWLDRPEKKNALSAGMWADLPRAVESVGADRSLRAVLVAGRGPSFTVGIDLEMLASLAPAGASEAERRLNLLAKIEELQSTMSAFADCPIPVIAAIHGYCLGAGIDLITACDIRLGSEDAIFGVRETRMGLVADVGTLQRLPRIVGQGHVAEMVYTGTDITAARAKEIGLLNHVYPDRQSLHQAAREMADEIAANSPLVVRGAKRVLARTEGQPVKEGLDYVAVWNAAFLLSDDLAEAMAAHIEKRPPSFEGR